MSRWLIALLLVAGLSADVSAREYVRSAAVHRAFLKTTGYPHGRPGWVADHILPLCAGGKDALENLQWQTVEDARVKDRAEKRLCQQLRALVAGVRCQLESAGAPMTVPNPIHGDMVRDERDEWPSDEPIGSFDITLSPGGILGYPAATAHMLFVCPNGKRCGVLLGPSPATREHPDATCVWGWNGDLERPTLTPSLNCIAEKDGKPTSGCGWHGFITNGVMR